MGLTDFLFPKFCLGCGHIGAYLCPSCFARLKPVEKSLCFYCKRGSYLGLTHPGCSKKFNIDGTLSLFYYTSLMKKIVKNIKYRLARSIFDELVANIGPEYLDRLFLLKSVFNGALIQPIPLSREKLKSRGFNQAQDVAIFFNSVLGLKMADFLERKREIKSQAAAESNLERYRNIKGAFVLRPWAKIEGKKIVLVDDVITTGATGREAARVLKIGGADRVYVLSLAE
jgi:ComF family protein